MPYLDGADARIFYEQSGTNLIANSILWDNTDGNLNGTLASKQAYLDTVGTLTITNCPCTVTKPVTTYSSVICNSWSV